LSEVLSFLELDVSLPELDVSLLERDVSLPELVSLWGVSALLGEVEDDVEPLPLEEPALDDFLA
jgi:hypothetical protein